MRDNLKKFFLDPDWKECEDLLNGYIHDLEDASTIDINQSAETVKAEIIGRQIARDRLKSFLTEVGFVREDTKDNSINFE